MTGRKIDLTRTKRCTHLYVGTSIRIKPLSDKRASRIFSGMVRRCYNKESKDFKWYGDKGIGICKEWQDDPEQFSQWYK